MFCMGALRSASLGLCMRFFVVCWDLSVVWRGVSGIGVVGLRGVGYVPGRGGCELVSCAELFVAGISLPRPL